MSNEFIIPEEIIILKIKKRKKQELYEKQISIIVKKTIILVKDYMIPVLENIQLMIFYYVK